MIDYQKIQMEIKALEKSNLYQSEQLETIKYAMYAIKDRDFLYLLTDPSIPNEFMTMYISLNTRKINVKKYIEEKWHEKGFDSKQLYELILADSKGYDISEVDLNDSVEKISEILNHQIAQKKLKEKYEVSSLSSEELLKLKKIGFAPNVAIFLLRIAEEYEIESLLDEKLKDCTLEQMKYLVSVYTTGVSIEAIKNSNLSVEEMKEIVLHFKDSVNFLNSVRQSRDDRRKESFIFRR